MAPSVHNVNTKYGTRNPILITSRASGSAETLIVTEAMTLRAQGNRVKKRVTTAWWAESVVIH